MSLEKKVVKLLKEKKLKVTTAESCTGGLVSSSLINVAGASNVIDCAFVTYSEEMKSQILQVNPQTINEKGVVSLETAREMAMGALKKANSDLAISVTGYAGPKANRLDKTVGIVCIGLADKKKVYAKAYKFLGNRMRIRKQATKKCLELLLEYLQNNY